MRVCSMPRSRNPSTIAAHDLLIQAAPSRRRGAGLRSRDGKGDERLLLGATAAGSGSRLDNGQSDVRRAQRAVTSSSARYASARRGRRRRRRAGVPIAPSSSRCSGRRVAPESDAHQLASDGRRGGLHRQTTAMPRHSRRRAVPGVAEHVAANTPGAQLRVAIGGAIPGFVSYEALLRDRDGATLPIRSSEMRCSTRRARRASRKAYRSSAPPTSPSLVASADYRPGRSIHLVTGPLYHAAPLSLSMAVPQLFGASVVLMDGWDCERALELIERHRVTHAPGADDDASAAVAARGSTQATRSRPSSTSCTAPRPVRRR